MSIVFVTGSSRSGTTMMGRILNKNSNIFTFNELHFFEQLCESAKLNNIISYDEALKLCDTLLGIQYTGFLQYKKTDEYKENATEIIDKIEQDKRTPVNIYKAFISYVLLANNKIIACDQTPRNVLYIEDILSNIPDSKILCLVRDPRAVMLSQKRKWKRKFLGAGKIPLIESIRSYFNYHPYTISKLWVAATKQSLKWQNDPRVMLVKFEDLTEAPEDGIKKISNFLGVRFEYDMLKIPHIGSSNKLDTKNTLGITAATKETWKNDGLTKAELYINQKVAGGYMDKLGYNKEYYTTPYISYFFQIVVFPVKMIISLMLNLKRMKNLKQAILKRL